MSKYIIVARDAGFIGCKVDNNGQWDHTGFTYQSQAQFAAQDIFQVTKQTRIEIVNQVSDQLILSAMPGCSPHWR